jgi:ERCC4-type nuclease
MVLITADVREEASGVPSLLEQLAVTVERRNLSFGDYVLGPGTVVERKSTRDLHLTIAAGRFWPQIGRLRAAGRWPYLVIEGEHLRGPVDADAIRGACLAASDLGVTVLRTQDVRDTSHWLRRLALRRQDGRMRDRPAYAQRPKRPPGVVPAEQALAAAPGISVVTARRLLSRFGTLEAVVLAPPEAWQQVEGMGPLRAESLRRLIHEHADAANHL